MESRDRSLAAWHLLGVKRLLFVSRMVRFRALRLQVANSSSMKVLRRPRAHRRLRHFRLLSTRNTITTRNRFERVSRNFVLLADRLRNTLPVAWHTSIRSSLT